MWKWSDCSKAVTDTAARLLSNPYSCPLVLGRRITTSNGRPRPAASSPTTDIVESLPKSPFLDEELEGQRIKRRKSKARAAKPIHSVKAPAQKPAGPNITPFQIRLQRNPYAHILASPMRQCALTDARLPRDLLLPWEAVRREIQPVSVSEESQDQTAKTDENSQDAPVKPIQEVWMLPEGLDTAEAHREESEQMRSAGLGKQQSKRPAGYRRRSLASHKLIEIMKVPIKKNNKGPRGPRRWHRLIPRHGPHLTQLIDPRDMTWRPDMENFIARKMRRRILAEMEYLQSRAGEEAELAHAYLGIVIVRGEEDLPAREDLVSKTLVQLTSSSGTEAGMDVEGDQSGSEERPNQSEATGAIIRHSGPELLGDDSLRVIREMLGPAISQAEANAAGSEGEEYEIFLTIKEKRVTRRLLQYLWQLRCYLRN